MTIRAPSYRYQDLVADVSGYLKAEAVPRVPDFIRQGEGWLYQRFRTPENQTAGTGTVRTDGTSPNNWRIFNALFVELFRVTVDGVIIEPATAAQRGMYGREDYWPDQTRGYYYAGLFPNGTAGAVWTEPPGTPFTNIFTTGFDGSVNVLQAQGYVRPATYLANENYTYDSAEREYAVGRAGYLLQAYPDIFLLAALVNGYRMERDLAAVTETQMALQSRMDEINSMGQWSRMTGGQSMEPAYII